MKKLALLALIPLLAFAQSTVQPPKPTDKDIVKLAWDYEQGANPAVKFKVYYGKVSGTYLASKETSSPENSLNLELPGDGDYFFTVTAVAADGLESLPAPEIKYTQTPRPNSPNNITVIRVTISVD